MGTILLRLHKAEQMDFFKETKPKEKKVDKPKGKVGFRADWKDIWDYEDDTKYREYFNWKSTLPSWLSKQWIQRFIVDENGEPYSIHMLNNMNEKQLSGMFKRYYQDAMNGYLHAVRAETMIRLGGHLDTLKPQPQMWWENKKGERWVPSDCEVKNPYELTPPEGFDEAHFVNPQVSEDIFLPGEKTPLTFNTSFNCVEPIVMLLVSEHGWKMTDAIATCANTCERCLNILLEEATGEPYDGRDTAHTHCELCKQIDPEYEKECVAREALRAREYLEDPSQMARLEGEPVFEGIRNKIVTSGKKMTGGSAFILPDGKLLPVWSHEGWLAEKKKDIMDLFDKGWIRISISGENVVGMELGHLGDSAGRRIENFLSDNPFKVILVDCMEGVKQLALEDIFRYGAREAFEKAREGFRAESVASMVADKTMLKSGSDETFGSFYIFPDDKIEQVDSHEEFEKSQKKARIELIEQGFIRVSAFGREAVIDVWDASDETLGRVQKFLSQHGKFKRIGINIFKTSDLTNIAMADVREFGIVDAFHGSKREYEGAFTDAKPQKYERQEGTGTERSLPNFATKEKGVLKTAGLYEGSAVILPDGAFRDVGSHKEFAKAMKSNIPALIKAGYIRINAYEDSVGIDVNLLSSDSVHALETFLMSNIYNAVTIEVISEGIAKVMSGEDIKEHGLMDSWSRGKVVTNWNNNSSTRTSSARIEEAVAPLVEALNKAGLTTDESCAGHMKSEGSSSFPFVRFTDKKSSNVLIETIKGLPLNFNWEKQGTIVKLNDPRYGSTETDYWGVKGFIDPTDESLQLAHVDMNLMAEAVSSLKKTAEGIGEYDQNAMDNMSDGSRGEQQKTIEYLPQDQKQWWLEYMEKQKKKYPGKMDVIPNDSEEGGVSAPMAKAKGGIKYGGLDSERNNQNSEVAVESHLVPAEEEVNIEELIAKADIDADELNMNSSGPFAVALQIVLGKGNLYSVVENTNGWVVKSVLEVDGVYYDSYGEADIGALLDPEYYGLNEGMEDPDPVFTLEPSTAEQILAYGSDMANYTVDEVVSMLKGEPEEKDEAYWKREYERNMAEYDKQMGKVREYNPQAYEPLKDEEITLESLYPDIALDMDPILEQYGVDAGVLDGVKVIKSFKYAPFYAIMENQTVTLYPVFFSLEEPIKKGKLIHELTHYIQEQTGTDWASPEEIATMKQMEEDYKNHKITATEFFDYYLKQPYEAKAYMVERDYLRSQGMPDEEIKSQLMKDLSTESEGFIDALMSREASLVGFIKQALHPVHKNITWREEYTPRLPKVKNFYRWVGYWKDPTGTLHDEYAERWVILRADVPQLGKKVRVVTDKFGHQGSAHAKYFNDPEEAVAFVHDNFNIDTSDVKISVPMTGITYRDTETFKYKLAMSIVKYLNDAFSTWMGGSLGNILLEMLNNNTLDTLDVMPPAVKEEVIKHWYQELGVVGNANQIKYFLDEIWKTHPPKEIKKFNSFINTKLLPEAEEMIAMGMEPGEIKQELQEKYGDYREQTNDVFESHVATGFNNMIRILIDRIVKKMGQPTVVEEESDRAVLIPVPMRGEASISGKFKMKREAKKHKEYNPEYHHEENKNKGYTWVGTCPHCGGVVDTPEVKDICPHCKEEYSLTEKVGEKK